MFVLTVQFTIKPEHADAFGEIVIRQAVNSKQLEPEFDVHKLTPHFADFSQKVVDLVLSKELAFFDRIEPRVETLSSMVH